MHGFRQDGKKGMKLQNVAVNLEKTVVRVI